jgi:hypothetical protein
VLHRWRYEHLEPQFNGDMWPWGVSPAPAIMWQKIVSTIATGETKLYVQPLYADPDSSVPITADMLDSQTVPNVPSASYFIPVIKLPPEILSADPAWKGCELVPYLRATRLIPLTAQPTSDISDANVTSVSENSASPRSTAMAPLPERTATLST